MAVKNPSATITMFLRMYCPSIVGTNGAFQVTSGRKMRGRKVVVI